MDGDSVTILRCAPLLRLAKLIRQDRIEDYDNARTFDAWTIQVGNLGDIEDLLHRIIDRPRFCAVRGALVNGLKARRIRRLVYPDVKTGAQPTLRDVPRRWLALDVEGVERPANVPATDLPACAAVALHRLPAAFRGVACIVQATAGHGRKPDLRLRLWYWLSRFTDGGELKRWLKGHPADPSIFRPAQAIYTAAPIFYGMQDHLPIRLHRIDGRAEVAVPSKTALAPPAREPIAVLPSTDSPGASRYAYAALRNAAARVAGAAVNNRHPTCVNEARGLARLVDAGLLSASVVQNALADALEQAGKTRDEGAAIAAWALNHPSNANLPDGVQ